MCGSRGRRSPETKRRDVAPTLRLRRCKPQTGGACGPRRLGVMGRLAWVPIGGEGGMQNGSLGSSA